MHLFPLMFFLLPKICALPHDLTFSGTDSSKDHRADRIIILSLIFALRLSYPPSRLLVSDHSFAFSALRHCVPGACRYYKTSRLPVQAQCTRRPPKNSGIAALATPPLLCFDASRDILSRTSTAPEPLAIPTEHLPFPVLPPGTHSQEHPLQLTSHRPPMSDSIGVRSEHSFTASETLGHLSRFGNGFIRSRYTIRRVADQTGQANRISEGTAATSQGSERCRTASCLFRPHLIAT
jgi:hypothetical protein